MKKLNPILLTSFLILFLFSCKDDDDVEPFNPDDSLVEYFRCNINGEPFQSLPSFACEPLLFDYYPEPAFGVDPGYVIIRGRNCFTNQHVGIRMYNFSPASDTIIFTMPSQADSISPFYAYYDISELLANEQLIEGKLIFSRFEPRTENSLGTVEGTFNFTVTNETQDSVFVITDGEFRYRTQRVW